ncbi:MAG TPA: lipid II flippase MurJ [Puia sp.]|nr:lipid II flippase MurJ [Puia sp.]
MFIKAESYKRGIVVSTVFNIINKGLVFLNSIIVAYFFGTQIKTDIYFYAYNTIMIFSLFITSLNASVLIPESMRLRIQQGESAAMHFLNIFFYLYIAITLVICGIVFFDPVRAFTEISSFSHSSLQTESSILLLATPLILLIPIVNLLTDIMTSYKHFSMPMIVGILNGIFSILFVLLFHKVLDVLSLLTGLILSYIINFTILVVLMRRRLHWKFAFHRVRIEKRIWKNIGFAQAGNITTSLSTYAPLYVLSGFHGGMITSLTFAQQLSAMPTNLITNQFSSVTGIKFNELYAKREFDGINRIFLSTSSFLLFILMPISGMFFLYAPQITSFLFERGAFHKSGVEDTALFLKYLGLLLPMMAINTFVARLFMAGQKIMESFVYQVIFNIVLISFIFVGVHRLGIIGYPAAQVALYLLNVVFSYFLLRWFFPQVKYGQVLVDFLKILGLNLLIFLLLLFTKDLLFSLYTLLSLVTGGAIYVGALLVANRYLKVNSEINAMLDRVRTYLYTYKNASKNTE